MQRGAFPKPPCRKPRRRLVRAEQPDKNVSNAEIDQYIKTFDDFNIQGTKLENSYNSARAAAEEMIAAIEDHFGISIPNADLKSFNTISDIIRYIEARVN